MIYKNKYYLYQLGLIFFSLLVLAMAFYLQFFKGLHPCPLCIMQQSCVVILCILSLLAYILNLKHAKLILVFQVFIVLLGLYFSIRQLWLQSLPPNKLPACMPSLDILIYYFPWSDILQTLFWGAADCAKTDMRILGLSIAAWSCLYFICFFITAIIAYFQIKSMKIVVKK